MKYTKATNYALHIIAFMVGQEDNKNISLQPLATHLNMPATYLSKILTQLVKANLIQSTPGMSGGYSLRKNPKEITFLDITRAIEGSGALFTCEMNEENCGLQKVMRDAETEMETYLESKTIFEVITSKKHHVNCNK